MNCPPKLAAALVQVQAGLADPAWLYLVKANYYDFYDDVEESRPCCWLAMLWLHAGTFRNLELLDDQLRVDLLLDRPGSGNWTRVQVPFAKIWEVSAQRASATAAARGVFTFDHRARSLYYEAGALRLSAFEQP